MSDSGRTERPTHHVLLIGIDAYRKHPLYGCVNDIDAIQQLLLAADGSVPVENITRLASPHSDAVHDRTVPERLATAANIRDAFLRLTSDAVNPGDRVFIHYSGHGTRAPVETPAGVFWREAIVPVDHDVANGGLLLDVQVNAWLAAMVARTPAVTLVLDCCHSAGVTRNLPDHEMVPRFMPVAGSEPRVARRDGELSDTLGSRGMGASVDDSQVVAACLNHEVAHESTTARGMRHGLLTRALVAELGCVPHDELLATPWGRLWDRVRAAVVAANPAQHPWMTGGLARAVFGGPPVDADVGFSVRRIGSNAYEIDAGALAGVTQGGKVALYGTRPLRFPVLGSSEDVEARLATVPLLVTSAETARSAALADGPGFDIPHGARGRLIEAGAPSRLRCAVVPHDSSLAAALATSPLLTLVSRARAEVCLQLEPEGTWDLLDDVHRGTADQPALVRFSDTVGYVAVAVLEQYFRYALPLRMATASRDLPGAVRIEVLRCPRGRVLTPSEKDGGELPELASSAAFTYEARAGDGVAIRVRNTAGRPLRITLLNVAASGKVQHLGDQSVNPGAFQVFWAASSHGRPFELNPPPGARTGIDRLVAIGTTNLGSGLHNLGVRSTFAEVVKGGLGVTRDFGESKALHPPLDMWTASQAIVRCRDGSP